MAYPTLPELKARLAISDSEQDVSLTAVGARRICLPIVD